MFPFCSVHIKNIIEESVSIQGITACVSEGDEEIKRM